MSQKRTIMATLVSDSVGLTTVTTLLSLRVVTRTVSTSRSPSTVFFGAFSGVENSGTRSSSS